MSKRILIIMFIKDKKLAVTLLSLSKKIFIFLANFLKNIRLFYIKNNWILCKSRNFYSPTLQATVYRYGDEWSLARFSVHYKGYKSKQEAMNAAFRMWKENKTSADN